MVQEDHRPVQTGKVSKKPAKENRSVPSGEGVREGNLSPIIYSLEERCCLKYVDSSIYQPPDPKETNL